MSDNLVVMPNEAVQKLPKLELLPMQLDEEYSLATYTKLPLSRLPDLGIAFEPLAKAVQNVANGPGAVSGLYKVTIPSGTHLAEFKSGVGNLGAVLNEENRIAGQAVLNPLVCDPTMVFMAAALANIDKKLDAIQEIQKEMMDFLERKERAEVRGNLVFLSDILNNYRYNWNNERYKNSNHVKVLDIRQAAEKQIIFYRDDISDHLRKKTWLHSDQDAKKQIAKIQAAFKEYQLALYTHSFSSFLDVMLGDNFASEYLDGIKSKIEEYSWEYRELYTKCYDQLEAYSDSSIQASLLKGLKKASRATGEAVSKIPVLSKGSLDEALLEAGDRLEELSDRRTSNKLRLLSERQSSCVRPFVENIEAVSRYYNNPISLAFDKETVYLGVSEVA